MEDFILSFPPYYDIQLNAELGIYSPLGGRSLSFSKGVSVEAG